MDRELDTTGARLVPVVGPSGVLLGAVYAVPYAHPDPRWNTARVFFQTGPSCPDGRAPMREGWLDWYVHKDHGHVIRWLHDHVGHLARCWGYTPPPPAARPC